MVYSNSTPYSNPSKASGSGSTTPGGTNTSIQYNSNGVFTGSSLLSLVTGSNPANGFNFTLASSGNSPTIKTIGNNENISMNFQSKGNGTFDFLNSDNETLFKIKNPAGTLDRNLFVAAADNTSLVELGIEGTPANASLQITPKGNGSVNIAPSGTSATDVGELRLFEGSNGAEYIGLKAPNSITNAISFTLPSLDGSNGDVLITNGAGNLSFAPVAASSGTSGLIQIADGSNGFTSDPNFYYNTTSDTLSVGIGISATKLRLHESQVSQPSYIQITNNTSGSAITDGLLVGISGTGLAEINNRENTDIAFYTNNIERLRINTSGDALPSADTSQDLGGAANRWQDIYATNSVINTSDLRQKYDIKTSELGLQFIKQLNPVSYLWRDGGKRPHYGFISQEVKKSIDLIGKDFAGFIYNKKTDSFGLRYSEFIAPIVKAIQELDATLTVKAALLLPAQETLKELEAKVEELGNLKASLLVQQNLNNKIDVLEAKLKEYENLDKTIKNLIDEGIDSKIKITSEEKIPVKKSWWDNFLTQLKKLLFWK